MRDTKHNIKKYFTFDTNEVKDLLITVIVIGFIFSFNKWGTNTFDFFIGLQNFFSSILIVGLAFLVHETAHKAYAIHKGYEAKYKIWFPGLMIGLILTIISNGQLFFLAPGFVIISAIPFHRVGKYYSYMSYKDQGLISFMGPLSNIVLALIFKTLTLVPFINQDILMQGMIINVWLAVFNILPIPPLDGSKVFFGSRMFYFFGAGLIIASAALMFFTNVIITIVTAIVLAVITTAIGYMSFER